jgi:hypothetical protein
MQLLLSSSLGESLSTNSELTKVMILQSPTPLGRESSQAKPFSNTRLSWPALSQPQSEASHFRFGTMPKSNMSPTSLSTSNHGHFNKPSDKPKSVESASNSSTSKELDNSDMALNGTFITWGLTKICLIFKPVPLD